MPYFLFIFLFLDRKDDLEFWDIDELLLGKKCKHTGAETRVRIRMDTNRIRSDIKEKTGFYLKNGPNKINL